MPTATIRALVLGCTPVNEQDKIAWLFTAEKGLVKAVAPGALKAGNRFGSLFELFTEGEFQYHWNEEREMITLAKGEIIQSHFHIVSRPENIFYFYLMADILQRFTPAQSQSPRSYRLLKSVLAAREKGGDMRRLLLYFLIWIIRIEGLLFHPRLCSNCQARNIKAAWLRSDFRGLLCARCHQNERWSLTDAELGHIEGVLRHTPEDDESNQDKIDLAKLLRLFIHKIEYHGESTLPSTQFLPEFR